MHHARFAKRLECTLTILLLGLTLVSCHEAPPSTLQSTPDASTLKIEAKESEASITLGKDLILGPPSANSTSVNVAADALGTSISRKAASSRGAYVVGSRYWAGKGPKATWKADSYLEALKHSRTSDDPREGVVRIDPKVSATRREYVQGPVYKAETEYGTMYASKSPRIVYGGPAFSPGDSHGPSFPKPSTDRDNEHRYGAAQNQYGSLQNSYGPPQDDSSFYSQPSSHGPPGNSYLPPQQGYGPSIHTSVPVQIHGAPYALPDVSHISILPSIDLGLPFALKLNAFTIAKIILKLVIFKMIVKFIAVICLLLFIPKLEIIKKKEPNKGDDDDDEERSLSSPYATWRTLNDLEATVRSSVEKYEAQNGTRSNTTEECTTLECHVTGALAYDESWGDYFNLFKSYVEEERRLAKREEQ